MIRLIVVVLALVSLSGCYYVQAAKGQWELTRKREPIAEVLDRTELTYTAHESGHYEVPFGDDEADREDYARVEAMIGEDFKRHSQCSSSSVRNSSVASASADPLMASSSKVKAIPVLFIATP